MPPTTWPNRPTRDRGAPPARFVHDGALVRSRWQRNLRRTLELLEDGLHPAGVALVVCDCSTPSATRSPSREGNRVRQAHSVGVRRGFAVALATKVAVARPTGVGRALATCEIPIEGRDEWLAAAGLSA